MNVDAELIDGRAVLVAIYDNATSPAFVRLAAKRLKAALAELLE